MTRPDLKIVRAPKKKRRKKKSIASSIESRPAAETSSSTPDPPRKEVRKKRPPMEGQESGKRRKKVRKKRPPEQPPVEAKVAADAMDTTPQYHLVIIPLGEYPRCETYSDADQVRQAIRELLDGRAVLDMRLFLFHGNQLRFRSTVLNRPDIRFETLLGGDMVVSNSPETDFAANGQVIVVSDDTSPARAGGDDSKALDDDLTLDW